MTNDSWTDAEGAALCRATEEAFPAIALPEDDALVHDIRFDDMAQMAAACRGKTWRDLDGEGLFTTFRSFASLATDDGFCALLPAFLVQSVMADDDYRDELQGTVMAALDVSEYRGSREAWNTHLARTTRRVIMMTPEQRWVAREFSRLANTVDPKWHLSWGARFWEAIATTDAPLIRPDPKWRRG